MVLSGGTKDLDRQGIPVQYISVYDKPILMYTLECFENHPQVDAIAVVSLAGWEAATWAFAKQFNITKLKWIATGGNNGQESIYNGIKSLGDNLNDEDLLVIHDGTRPMLDRDVLTDVIRIAEEKGSAAAATPFTEQMFYADKADGSITKAYLNRDKVKKVTTPQAYLYGDLCGAYKEAVEKQKSMGNDSYTDTMMVDLGREIHFAAGSDRNIKIETADDIALFRAMLDENGSGWLK